MARRWWAGIALAVLVLNGGVAAASPPPEPSGGTRPPAVAGVTTLRGDTTATMNVRVPTEAVLDLTPVERDGQLEPTGMRVTGGRAYVGFLLTERSTAEGLYVVGARLPRALTDGATKHRAIGYGQPALEDRSESAVPAPLAQPAPPTCTRCRIPAGNYRLQLITMGKPAAVEITFEGLRGSTSLRPSRRTLPFGFSGSFRPGGGDPALGESGGMDMGLGWTGREAGVLLTTYQLDVTPDALPAAHAEATSCRSVGRDEYCSDTRMSLGTTPSMAGFGAMSADAAKQAGTSLSFGTLGFAEWKARMSMLWLPTRPPASNVVEVGVGIGVGGSTQVSATRTFR